MDLSVYISIISLLIATVSVYLSILSWRKNRIIYGIEIQVIRQTRGTKADLYTNNNQMNSKLSSGKYTIIGTYQRLDKDIDVILGKLKQ